MGIFDDEFTATFNVITDLDHNQIASFHTGAMARAKELSLRNLDSTPNRSGDYLAQRSGGDAQVHGRMPRPGPALRL